MDSRAWRDIRGTGVRVQSLQRGSDLCLANDVLDALLYLGVVGGWLMGQGGGGL